MAGELLRKTNFLQLDQWCSSKLIGILKEKCTLTCKTRTNKTRVLLVPQITSNLPSWPAFRRVDGEISDGEVEQDGSMEFHLTALLQQSQNSSTRFLLSQSQFSITPLCCRTLDKNTSWKCLLLFVKGQKIMWLTWLSPVDLQRCPPPRIVIHVYPAVNLVSSPCTINSVLMDKNT